MQFIAFITERAVIARILDHIGAPSRAPRMGPIRGLPGDGNLTQRDGRSSRRSLNLEPPVDVMSDYENQNHELVW